MNITEKLSYIKGLAEGLSLDESKPEVKVINAMLELLEDISYSVSDMEELYDELSGQVDEIDQDLADVETELYDDEEDDDDCYDFAHGDDCGCGCGHHHHHHFDDDDFDDIYGDGYEDEDDEEPFYEVTCGACGQKLTVAEDVLLEGEIECPNCGELLEFDFSDLFEEDDECGCGCEDCAHSEDSDENEDVE